jgi:hypothetical protein
VVLPSTRFYAKRRTIGVGPSRSHGSGGVVSMGDVCPELSARQRPVCVCGRPMQVRQPNALSAFWSCPRFPVCRHTKSIDRKRFESYLQRDAARRFSLRGVTAAGDSP